MFNLLRNFQIFFLAASFYISTSGIQRCRFLHIFANTVTVIIIFISPPPPAAAAAKSPQSCPTLWDPIDGSPPGSPVLGFSRQEHWSGLSFPSPMHERENWKSSRSSCSSLSDPMDCSPRGSSAHGIFQARVLEWGAVAFSYMYIYMYIYIHINLCVCLYVCVYQTTSPAFWETCMQIKKQ